MATITINGVTYDPENPPVGVESAAASADVSTTNYVLVQTAGPMTAEQQAQLEATGIRILEYVPEDAYICHYAPGDLSPVGALPFVAFAGPYMKGFKIPPQLQAPAGGPPMMALNVTGPATSMAQDPRNVEIVFHDDVDPEAVRVQLAQAIRVNPEDLQIAGHKALARVQPQMLDRIAAVDAVRHVEPVIPNKLHNTVAIGIIGVDQVHAAPAGLRGRGQIVAVCDTGFDNGVTNNVHPAFTGRVNAVIPLGRPTGNDPDGHGTHVAGSVLGNGASMAMGGPVIGAAPEATLVMQSVLDPFGGLGGLPANLNTLFAQAHAEGARIHTNSWGAPTRGAYNANSHEVDEYAWDHRDMTILFSAGNEGADPGGNGVIDPTSIGSPGTAKNCITIGASESDRPTISKKWGVPWPQDYPANPIRDDLWADNPEGLAAFSSRGPTVNGRIKPDLVAPGTAILSAHSRAANVGSFWGTSSDPAYCFMGGTSMSTPIVAGCAALVREFLGGAPSSALIKAMLINGATDMTGQYVPSDAPAIPNNAEGFGRVNMPATVGPYAAGETVTPTDEGAALRTGDTAAFDATLQAQGELKVTLVWVDPPGEALQNDLDLIVRGPGGLERHGNMPPNSTAFDRHNNVEQVYWRNAPPGDYEIVVRAHRVPVKPQSFALVVRTR